MTALNYSSIAVTATLTQSVEAIDTVWQVSDSTGWPTAPFKLLCDKDRPAEEVVICVSISGTTITVLRGQDGTPASHHDVAAPVVHGFSAGEFQSSSDHIAAVSGVHGVAGDLVGTVNPQVMDRKTFQSQTGSGPALIAQSQTGQAANLIDFRSETGSVVGSVKPSGRITTPGVDSSSSSTFTAGSAGLVPLGVQMAPGQTARPFQIKDSGGNEVAAVTPNGTVIATAVQVTGGTALGTTTGTSLVLSGDITALNATFNANTQMNGNASVAGVLVCGNFNTTGTLSVQGITSNTEMVHRNNVPVPVMAAGTVSVNVVTASFAQTSVTWPAGRFTQPPIVTCSLQGAPTNSGKYSARAINIDASGCIIQVYSGDASANTWSGVVGWHAVQMTSSSASG